MKSQVTPTKSFQMLILVFVLSTLFISTGESTSVKKAAPQGEPLNQPKVFSAQGKVLSVARQLEIPIAIVSVKNLENDWLIDLEIEVENQSGKPIYYLAIDFTLPDVPKDEQGRSYGWFLSFGNWKLLNPNTRATPDDKAVPTGQKLSLKVPDYDWKGLQYHILQKGYSIVSTRRILVRVSDVSFGDGTGFIGGAAFPPKRTSNTLLREEDKEVLVHQVKFSSEGNSRKNLSAKKGLISKTDNNLPLSISINGSNVEGSCPPPDSGCYRYEETQFPCYGDQCGLARSYSPPPVSNELNFPCLHKIEDYKVCYGDGYPRYCLNDRGIPCEAYQECRNSCNVSACSDCAASGGTWNNSSCSCCNPNAVEICGDGIDNNCDGRIDENCPPPEEHCPLECTLVQDGCYLGADPCDLSLYQGCPPGFSRERDCCCVGSPVILDINGNGYDMTDFNNGVNFDLNNDGIKEKLSWTAQNSDDEFLVLDRDGNGKIESGREIFGNTTPQPRTSDPNGFIALAEFDKPEQGGNNDGKINASDRIFSSLRLWQDVNHNGISEVNEIHTLPSRGVYAIDLNYHESRRKDNYGNWFRYRAKVYDSHGYHIGRWAWDVFLLKQQGA